MRPAETNRINLNKILSGQLDRDTAMPRGSRIAVAVTSLDRQNHDSGSLTTGAIDTEDQKLTSVNESLTLARYQIGIPDSAEPGTLDEDHGIHGSGENGSPLAVNSRGDRKAIVGDGTTLPPRIFEIGETPASGRGLAPSVMNDPDAPHVQNGDDRANNLLGKSGLDDISGGKGRDTFWFRAGHGQGDPTNTLEDGDRIRDYESGEQIIIDGVNLSGRDITVNYDPEKNETRIGLDLPDGQGNKDGMPDKTIILDGDKRGDVSSTGTCCGGQATTIYINIPKAKDTGQLQQQVLPRSTPEEERSDEQPHDKRQSRMERPRTAGIRKEARWEWLAKARTD